jgi:hypothetical protein
MPSGASGAEPCAQSARRRRSATSLGIELRDEVWLAFNCYVPFALTVLSNQRNGLCRQPASRAAARLSQPW